MLGVWLKKGHLYLTTHETHFIYDYIASGIWIKNNEETVAAFSWTPLSDLQQGIFYMHQPHKQDITYLGILLHRPIELFLVPASAPRLV